MSRAVYRRPLLAAMLVAVMILTIFGGARLASADPGAPFGGYLRASTAIWNCHPAPQGDYSGCLVARTRGVASASYYCYGHYGRPQPLDVWVLAEVDDRPNGGSLYRYHWLWAGDTGNLPGLPVCAANPFLPLVPNVRVTPGVYSVSVSWSAVAGAQDYRVYAAAGCDVLPPPNDAYQLVKSALGSSTTWTHQGVSAMCMNYAVVAVRDAIEGVRPAFGLRALPFRTNEFHTEAWRHFFSEPPASGDTLARTAVAAGPDRGIVVVRAFIRDKDWFSGAIGDHRSFTPVPTASSKVSFAWDTGSGQVAVYVRKSCAIGASFPGGPVQTLCRDALPIAFVSDAAAVGDDDTDPRNLVSVSLSSTGHLNLGLSSMNAWDRVCVGPVCGGPGFGRINARVAVQPASGQTYSAQLVADKFPAWEFVRYPEFVQLSTLGQFGLIGTRDQTVIADLSSGVQSTCTSVAPEERAQFTKPMSCA